MEAGDRQLEERVREVAQRIIHEEQGEEVKQVIRTIENSQTWHLWAAVATVLSAVVAICALGLGAWSYYESAKREADIAANEALMEHFNYATQQGVPLGGEKPENSSDVKYELVATHGIYTANVIVDLTEGTDERVSWNNTVRGLLDNYEGFVVQEGLPCAELDGQFETLAKNHLGELKCAGASSQSR